jgi:hypothetical protein
MIRFRSVVLLALSISGWGLAHHCLPIEAIAQNAPATQTTTTYDQLMKVGYEATATRNYPVALKKFQQAQAQRPDDPYATSAVANIQTYLARSASPATSSQRKSDALPLPLIIGSVLLTIALAGALVSLLSRYRSHPESKKPSQRVRVNQLENPNPAFEENGTPNGEQKNFNNFEDNDLDREASLPVQTTSRIPSVDLILRLIENLRDGDPPTRRRAIWKLAQMSDSRAMQPLVDSMVDGDSYERSLTLEALAQICTRSLRPMNQALAISLQDKNPQVRKNAIRDLTRLYDIMSQITQLICHALDDSDEEVQETARWAIRQLNLQLPPRLEIEPLETTGEPEDEVPETSYTESTEVQS